MRSKWTSKGMAASSVTNADVDSRLRDPRDSRARSPWRECATLQPAATRALLPLRPRQLTGAAPRSAATQDPGRARSQRVLRSPSRDGPEVPLLPGSRGVRSASPRLRRGLLRRLGRINSTSTAPRSPAVCSSAAEVSIRRSTSRTRVSGVRWTSRDPPSGTQLSCAAPPLRAISAWPDRARNLIGSRGAPWTCAPRPYAESTTPQTPGRQPCS